ncbi:unnamed protein product, partial [Scytosiphon promiscuus]
VNRESGISVKGTEWHRPRKKEEVRVSSGQRLHLLGLQNPHSARRRSSLAAKLLTDGYLFFSSRATYKLPAPQEPGPAPCSLHDTQAQSSCSSVHRGGEHEEEQESCVTSSSHEGAISSLRGLHGVLKRGVTSGRGQGRTRSWHN